MYCKNCGEEISEKAFVCPKCGVKVQDDQPLESSGDSSVVLGIIALVVGLFIPLVAWICGGIGLSKASKNNNQTGKVLNIIGLVLGTIMFFVYFSSYNNKF